MALDVNGIGNANGENTALALWQMLKDALTLLLFLATLYLAALLGHGFGL